MVTYGLEVAGEEAKDRHSQVPGWSTDSVAGPEEGQVWGVGGAPQLENT